MVSEGWQTLVIPKCVYIDCTIYCLHLYSCFIYDFLSSVPIGALVLVYVLGKGLFAHLLRHLGFIAPIRNGCGFETYRYEFHVYWQATISPLRLASESFVCRWMGECTIHRGPDNAALWRSDKKLHFHFCAACYIGLFAIYYEKTHRHLFYFKHF